MAHVVQHLPSKPEALYSNPNTDKRKGSMIQLFVFWFLAVGLVRLLTPITVPSSNVEQQQLIIQPPLNQDANLICHWLTKENLKVTSIKRSS
jgi:hypothetical protein